MKDLTGRRFGNLVALESTPKRDQGCVVWKFQCDCGNIVELKGAAVTSGNTTSCGCQKFSGFKSRNEVPSIVGESFGLLTVIEDLGYQEYYNTGHRRRKALCQCRCGNIVEVWDQQLKSGRKTSCGCQYSRGETIIKELLIKHKILFKQEYSFDDLYQYKKGHFRFDFAIFNEDGSLSHLIEFHGKQHYQETTGTWTQTDTLEERQLRDKLKEEYCKEHNIPLIIIPYDKIGVITIDLLLKGGD